jgi:hypothetical protein
MISVNLLLLILALVMFILATVGVSVGRFNPIGAGLACWVLSLLLR